MADIFAFHVTPENSSVDYIGRVMKEKGDMLRLQVIDAFMATGCGVWWETNEIKDVQKKECRMFLDKIDCLETALRINIRLRQQEKVEPEHHE